MACFQYSGNEAISIFFILKMRLHQYLNGFPEILSNICMNACIADYGKFSGRSRSRAQR